MAQDKFNAKAETTDLSMLLKKNSVHGKNSTTNLASKLVCCSRDFRL